MNKEALRTEFINKGWEVQPVADWTTVSVIEGKTKYDVNAVSPENVFGTAQVVEDANGAVADGFWKDKVDFTTDLRAFLDSKEAGAVYAISATEIKEADEVAEVKVYSGVTGGVEVATYVVKRRNDTFDFKKIV